MNPLLSITAALVCAASMIAKVIAQCPAGYQLTCTKVAEPAGPLAQASDAMLTYHNALRAKHQAPALAWDKQLEAAAKDWASQCKFMHSGSAGQGENLFAVGGAVTGSPADMALQTWYDEIQAYNFANPGYSPATGHATQMLWRDSKLLGCAMQRCPSLGASLGWGPDTSIVVCRYAPPGNVVGYFQYNVLPPSYHR